MYLHPIKTFVNTPIEDNPENAFPEYHPRAIGDSNQGKILDEDMLLAKKVENFFERDRESNKLNKYAELESPTGIASKRRESSLDMNSKDYLGRALENTRGNKDLSDVSYNGILEGAREDSYLNLQPYERSTSQEIFYNYNWKVLTGVVAVVILLIAVATYSCFSLIKSITHKKPKKSEFKVDRWLAGSNRSSSSI